MSGEPVPSGRNAYVPMRARSRDEQYRTATPLELLFDLCFVVAVAQVGQRLVHAVLAGHAARGLLGYLFVFFAVWWAWVNFTWFASAYDTDDVLYRVATFVQITGALTLAAGVPRAFDQGDFMVAVIGYVIMRLALTMQWLRAASGEQGAARTTALRFASGLVVVQAGWVVLVLLPSPVWWWGFVPLAIADLGVPVFAERSEHTPWNPRHIGERYGLFTLIVLGETVAAATMAVQSGLAETARFGAVLPIAFGGLLIVFAAYWIYFSVPIHEYLGNGVPAFVWGYGHYLIFAAAAAIGAGLEVAVTHAIGASTLGVMAASSAVTIPTALFFLTVWALHARYHKRTVAQQLVLPIGSVLILAATAAGPASVALTGLIAAGLVAVGVYLHGRPPPHAEK